MKSLGLFSQILTIAVAVVIAIFYVQPTVLAIGQTQSDIDQYAKERAAIANINQTLNQKRAIVQSVAPQNATKLSTYMPAFVDDLSVMRDIKIMAERSNVTLDGLSFEGVEIQKSNNSRSEDVTPDLGELAPTPHSFTLTTTGRYEDTKTFLLTLEQNEYPLEIHAFDLSTTEDDLFSANMTVVTYSDGSVDLTN